MRYKVLILLMLVICTSLAYAWTPTSDIDLRNYYELKNATNISSDNYCLRGDCITAWPSVTTSGLAPKIGDGVYLYNDTSIMYFNDSKLSKNLEGYANWTQANQTFVKIGNVSIYNSTYDAFVIYGYNSSDAVAAMWGAGWNGTYNATYDRALSLFDDYVNRSDFADILGEMINETQFGSVLGEYVNNSQFEGGIKDFVNSSDLNNTYFQTVWISDYVNFTWIGSMFGNYLNITQWSENIKTYPNWTQVTSAILGNHTLGLDAIKGNHTELDGSIQQNVTDLNTAISQNISENTISSSVANLTFEKLGNVSIYNLTYDNGINQFQYYINESTFAEIMTEFINYTVWDATLLSYINQSQFGAILGEYINESQFSDIMADFINWTDGESAILGNRTLVELSTQANITATLESILGNRTDLANADRTNFTQMSTNLEANKTLIDTSIQNNVTLIFGHFQYYINKTNLSDTLNDNYYLSSEVDTALADQDACSEITDCVSNAWDECGDVSVCGYLTAELDAKALGQLQYYVNNTNQSETLDYELGLQDECSEITNCVADALTSEADPGWDGNYTRLKAADCDKVIGMEANGSFKCGVDQEGSGDVTTADVGSSVLGNRTLVELSTQANISDLSGSVEANFTNLNNSLGLYIKDNSTYQRLLVNGSNNASYEDYEQHGKWWNNQTTGAVDILTGVYGKFWVNQTVPLYSAFEKFWINETSLILSNWDADWRSTFNQTYENALSHWDDYYNKTDADARYLQSYTETDPKWIDQADEYLNKSEFGLNIGLYYNESEADDLLAAQDACSEITGCVENALTVEVDPGWDGNYTRLKAADCDKVTGIEANGSFKCGVDAQGSGDVTTADVGSSVYGNRSIVEENIQKNKTLIDTSIQNNFTNLNNSLSLYVKHNSTYVDVLAWFSRLGAAIKGNHTELDLSILNNRSEIEVSLEANRTEINTALTDQDECSEITGCVVGAITLESDTAALNQFQYYLNMTMWSAQIQNYVNFTQYNAMVNSIYNATQIGTLFSGYYNKTDSDDRYIQTEVDPNAMTQFTYYFNETESDNRYLQSYTETDTLALNQFQYYENKTQLALNYNLTNDQMKNLTAADCEAGYLVIGVEVNGSIKCSADSGGVDSEVDPGWDGNYTRMKIDCAAGQQVIGIHANGSFECVVDAQAAGGVGKSGAGHLWNDTTNIYINESTVAVKNESQVFLENVNFSQNVSIGTGPPAVQMFWNGTDSIINLTEGRGYLCNTSGCYSYEAFLIDTDIDTTYACSDWAACTDDSLWDANKLDGQVGSYYDDYDSVSDIPNAAPSDGDTTHFSLADEIYDWAVGLFIQSEVDPGWDGNFTRLQIDCGASQQVTGINANGSLECAVDATGAGVSMADVGGAILGNYTLSLSAILGNFTNLAAADVSNRTWLIAQFGSADSGNHTELDVSIKQNMTNALTSLSQNVTALNLSGIYADDKLCYYDVDTNKVNCNWTDQSGAGSSTADVGSAILGNYTLSLDAIDGNYTNLAAADVSNKTLILNQFQYYANLTANYVITGIRKYSNTHVNMSNSDLIFAKDGYSNVGNITFNGTSLILKVS